MELKDKLRELRRKPNYNQREMAQALVVCQATVSFVERGAIPNGEIIAKIEHMTTTEGIKDPDTKHQNDKTKGGHAKCQNYRKRRKKRCTTA